MMGTVTNAEQGGAMVAHDVDTVRSVNVGEPCRPLPPAEERPDRVERRVATRYTPELLNGGLGP